MELREISINDLKPAPYNPRQTLRPTDAGYRRLHRSITEFSLVQPIVWNERTGHVVAGHQRLMIAQARGMRTVPCVVVNLSLNREKALNIALNNRAVGSDWDENRLQELLLELRDAPGIDATLTGFDADELQDLLLRPVELPEEPDMAGDEEDKEKEEHVRATLVVSQSHWERVRRSLDRIIRRGGVEMHVRLGEG